MSPAFVTPVELPLRRSVQVKEFYLAFFFLDFGSSLISISLSSPAPGFTEGVSVMQLTT